MHCVHPARQLVDVGLNDDAVVEGDWCVTDDVVVHGVGWLKVSRSIRWIGSLPVR